MPGPTTVCTGGLLSGYLTPMEIATEALLHHTKEEMKGGKPKSASSRLCSASE